MVFEDIELVPFKTLEGSQELRLQYLGWLNNPEVVRSIASPELMQKKDMSFVDDSFRRFTQLNCQGFFVYHLHDRCFIGTAKLDNIDRIRKSAMDGIMIGEMDYWGKGISRKVYKILLWYGFEVLGLQRISSGCNESNIGMVKVLTSLGYQLEGRMRREDIIEGVFSDHLYFAILKEEYLSIK